MPENIPAPEAVAISLREHLEGRIAALAAHLSDAVRHSEETSTAQLESMRREQGLIQAFIKEATEKADKMDQQWRAQANEWRGTLETFTGNFASQTQLRALEKSREEATKALEKSLLAVNDSDRSRSEKDMKELRDLIRELETWKSNMQGRLWGIPVMVGLVVFIVTQLMRVLFPLTTR